MSFPAPSVFLAALFFQGQFLVFLLRGEKEKGELRDEVRQSDARRKGDTNQRIVKIRIAD